MTNEDLVALIQSGQKEYIPDLWAGVERFVSYKAYSYYNIKWPNRCATAGVTMDDLYQSGYFALLKAIDYYDPEKGVLFITIFGKFMTKEFYNVMGVEKRKDGWHTKGDALDTLTLSTDAPAYGGNLAEAESSESSLGDVIEDKKSETQLSDIEDALEQEEERQTLDKAIASALNEKEAQIIKEYFFNDKTEAELADMLNITRNHSHSIKAQALKKLKKEKLLEKYKEKYAKTLAETLSTSKTKLGTWKSSGMSQQEFFAIRLDEFDGLLKKAKSL